MEESAVELWKRSITDQIFCSQIGNILRHFDVIMMTRLLQRPLSRSNVLRNATWQGVLIFALKLCIECHCTIGGRKNCSFWSFLLLCRNVRLPRQNSTNIYRMLGSTLVILRIVATYLYSLYQTTKPRHGKNPEGRICLYGLINIGIPFGVGLK